MKALPIGGTDVAPESPVGLFVLVDFTKSDILPLLFQSLQISFQLCKRY